MKLPKNWQRLPTLRLERLADDFADDDRAFEEIEAELDRRRNDFYEGFDNGIDEGGDE